MDSFNTPHDVDDLFLANPQLFAYEIPTMEERRNLKVGDLVKLFFSVPGFQHPRAMWLTVTATPASDGNSFAGVLEDRYEEKKRNLFGEIRFSESHVYRLPLARPELENPLFDIEFRSRVNSSK